MKSDICVQHAPQERCMIGACACMNCVCLRVSGLLRMCACAFVWLMGVHVCMHACICASVCVVYVLNVQTAERESWNFGHTTSCVHE